MHNIKNSKILKTLKMNPKANKPFDCNKYVKQILFNPGYRIAMNYGQ